MGDISAVLARALAWSGVGFRAETGYTMAPLRERDNLFSGSFRVTARPYVPDSWDVPIDHPSATRFYVEEASGRTSSGPRGPGWELKSPLKQWHERQALRLWACRRLIRVLGREEAQRRINELQARLNRDVPGANAFLDLLLSITYELVSLRSRSQRWSRLRLEIQRKAASDARWWRTVSMSLGSWRIEEARAARNVAESVDSLVASLGAACEQWSEDTNGNRLSDIERSFLGSPRATWTCMDYQILPRQLKPPDISWIVAQAVVRYRDSHPNDSPESAVRRVSRYLELLGCGLERKRLGPAFVLARRKGPSATSTSGSPGPAPARRASRRST